MPKYEYTIRYNCNSNISFHNDHDHEWNDWEGDEDATPEEIEKSLYDNPDPTSPTNLPDGLDIALNESGFEWWVVVREVGKDDDNGE